MKALFNRLLHYLKGVHSSGKDESAKRHYGGLLITSYIILTAFNYTGSEASIVEYCNISDSKVTQARRLLAKISVDAGNNQNWWFEGLPMLALNFGQVEKMYVGGSEVVNAYYGAIKIK